MEDGPYRYEPLDVTIHDRGAFSCGSEPLDRYLRQQARQDVSNHVAAVYIQCLLDSTAILGYYSIGNLSIDAVDLPPELVRKLPRYPILPATLIGRLAVDQRHRGRGLGALLLFDALWRSLHSGIASMAMVVDAKDDTARRFCARFGFQSFVAQPDRLFLPMKDIAARQLERTT